MMLFASQFGKFQATRGIVRTVPRFSSPLPIVIITTAGGATITGDDLAGTVRIIPAGKHSQFPVRSDLYSSTIVIHTRGSSSNLPNVLKKQYAIDLPSKSAVLGMPSYDKWILQAEVYDPTFIRNSLGYSLARSFGYWSARTQKCEVIINSVYYGVHSWQESNDQDANRVNIAKNSVNATTNTGYLFAQDHYADGLGDPADIYVLTNRGNPLLFKYPKPKNLKDANGNITAFGQGNINYLKNLLDTAETALFGISYTNPLTGWRGYFDEDSFAVGFLLNELFKGLDLEVNSTYFNRTTNGKIKWGPFWDLDWTLGQVPLGNYGSPEGWMKDDIAPLSGSKIEWFAQMFTDAPFITVLKLRYTQARNGFLSNANVSALIESYATLLDAGPAQRNEQRWHHFASPQSGAYQPHALAPAGTFRGEVDRMKDWILARLAWMDTQLH